jgi:hypothetical protein
VIGVLALSCSKDAQAEEPAPAPPPSPASRWELAARAGYFTPPVRGGTTPFGAGFGARLGHAFASKLYLGVAGAGFLGGKDVDVTDRAALYGAELAYALGFPLGGDTAFVLRPEIGVGGVTIFRTDPSIVSGTTTRGGRTARPDVVSGASGQGSSSTTTVTNVQVSPGVGALVVSGAAFGGVRGTMLLIPGISYSGAQATTWLSYGLQAELGIAF